MTSYDNQKSTPYARLSRAAALTLFAGIACLNIAYGQGHQPPVGAANTAAKPEMRVAAINRAAQLINNIRNRLDACGDKGMLSLSGPVEAAQAPTVPERPALVWNAQLASAANRHSNSMAEQRFFDHVDNRGKTVGSRVTSTGYRWRVVGENLAAGHRSIDEAVQGWLLSTTHCEILVDARFTEFGLARINSSDPLDPYQSYWTLVVAKPRSKSKSPG